MNHCMPSALLLIALLSYSASAEGQSLGSHQMPQVRPSDASSLMPTSKTSWERWLSHGAHNSITTSFPSSPLSSESVGLAASNVSHVPSVEPGPGFIGPEPVDVPSGLKFDMGMERGDRGGRQPLP
jgi:hypothetical protein